MEKKSKYDTNPLDPAYVRKTDEIMGGTREVANAATGERATHLNEIAEAPTRRYYEPPKEYPSIFVKPPLQQPPAINGNRGARAGELSPYSDFAASSRPTSRHLPKLGLQENLAQILPYAPFYIGLVASIVELLLVPRSEVRTRFHAAQGLALQLAIAAISFIFGVVGTFAGNSTGGGIFSAAAVIFLIVSMVRVWKGCNLHVAPLNELTRLLNERIEPRK